MSTLEVLAQPPLQSSISGKGARIEWVDAAKGVGILLVVIGHAIAGLKDGTLVSADSLLVYIHYLIYSFHMPLFFFLSGIFIAKRVASGALDFSKSSTIKLGKAYLIWLPAQMLALSLAGSLANKPVDINTFDYISIIWEPRSNFWFIYALLIMNAFSALTLPKLGAGVMLILCLLFYSITQWTTVPPMLWGFFCFAPYYGFGLIFGLHPIKLKTNKSVLTLGAVAVTLIWLYMAQKLHEQDVHAWSIPTFSTAIAGSIAALLWIGISGGKTSNYFAYLGRESLPIYLIHITFTAGTRIIMDKILHIEDAYVILIFATFIGIAGPLVIKKIADRLKISSQIGLA